MKRDYATTFITEVVVVISYLLAFRVVATHLGENGFAEYALSRRTFSFLSPLAVVGLDVAIARFVAYALGNRSPERGYAGAALLLVGGATGILSALLWLFRDFFALLFFGSSTYVALITALPLLLVGGGLHIVAYGYLRGRSQIQRANVLMALNQGATPLAAALLGGDSVPSILTAMGGGWVVISALFLALTPMSMAELKPRVIELAKFGFPRMPGDLLQLALFALPGILFAHLVNIRSAGIVAFGVAALGMAGSVLTPISFVLLPTVAGLFARGSPEQVRSQVREILRITLPVLVLAIVAVEIFARPILRAYLGPQFSNGYNTLRLVMVGALPWGLYVILKSVIDARYVRPVNARNMLVASVTFVIVTVVVRLAAGPPAGIVLAFVLSLYVLGALTVIEVYRIVRGTQPQAEIKAAQRRPTDGPLGVVQEDPLEKMRRYTRDLEMLAKDSGLMPLGIFALAVVFALLTAWLALGQIAVIVGLGILLSVVNVVIAIQLQLYHRSQAHQYRQIESMFSLFSLLKLSHPLPPMRGWAVSPDFANVIVSLIQEQRPRCILEAGSGVSTLIAGYCLKQVGSGRIFSLEHDERFAEIARANIEKHGLQDIATVVHAPLKKIRIRDKIWLWYDIEPIKAIRSIDMVIVDGPPGDIQKRARYPALPILFDQLSESPTILLDDCARHDEKEIVLSWLRDFDGFVSHEVDTEKGTMVLRGSKTGPSSASSVAAAPGLDRTARGIRD